MGDSPKFGSFRVEELHVRPGLTPKTDERMIDLMKKALRGVVPVYFASIPLALCVPFDVDYRPDLDPVGAAAIAQVAAYARKGNWRVLVMIVYPRGRWFVVSDDYIKLFAALSGQPEYVPCWVLGKPEGDLLQQVQGPIALETVSRILGLG
ncbi:MAG: hypothetical protein FJ291_14905 [Planctomycetes bacterium]|nr:hypothetical protein [Planctomycetota bacterium]